MKKKTEKKNEKKLQPSQTNKQTKNNPQYFANKPKAFF